MIDAPGITGDGWLRFEVGGLDHRLSFDDSALMKSLALVWRAARRVKFKREQVLGDPCFGFAPRSLSSMDASLIHTLSSSSPGPDVRLCGKSD